MEIYLQMEYLEGNNKVGEELTHGMEFVGEAEEPTIKLKEIPNEDEPEVILDEATGQFIQPAHDKYCQEMMLDETTGEFVHPEKLSRDFTAQCTVEKEGSVKKTKSSSSTRVFKPLMSPPRVYADDQQPRPAHSNSGRRKQLFEDEELKPVDMRKSVLGLQVDGLDDSRDSSMKSDSSVNNEETPSQNRSQGSQDSSENQ